ncbi:MAG TPA: hypothetical protein VFQ53_33005 [Kofleriaceae bacterium]|nr:hypothetical protein [Kofleriaceae bacterium]
MSSEREDLEKLAKRAVRAAGRAAGVGGLGVAIFDDHATWDPVVPADIHAKLPPVAEDGTAACWMCRGRFAFAQLEIAGDAYACRTCLLRASAASAAPVDAETMTLGRPWWIVPAIALGVAAVATTVFVMLG